ncbi:magnesium transporter NIPA-domain-containing protein [Microdochium trichocladiopsis]|uniref:Magnesium transporter NIPA-domain-containing protein n=1 Tax=Microdochium trichocladiopsis TaxID=1682393 RepID=A0A9P8Y6S6_9PEZI|nr:magnesium transporter NIPA-domain-containing protein [Microdochium trichocladiopsis]KAH7031361.1 magnesium transporter NIPA-domain-containing protein [Microdochium trichocladiopsis]
MSRPAYFKAIGIGLAIASGCFIGVSFVMKKVGLLKANEKYNEVAGEGYGYLKNFHWWAGMTLMIFGEVCNFGAMIFTDAILVTALGALSVVITTILSAIFLKERLSLIGKVACFLCILGATIIVLNSPAESAVANIQEMQSFVIAPAFLAYAGCIILGIAFAIFWLGPRYGNKNMFTYISICSWAGALSVVATQGLGAAIAAQAGGTPQFNQWFLYVLLVFMIGTLLVEIVFLNKALNIYNAAMVTPTYYVYFTSTTIITSAILFKGFKGTAMQIVTVVMGFLTISSGVVLLQLSKSAKDVPDTAVFAGDLDQIQTIAEQEQPETEPKADAIRGAAAIVRRFSTTRQKMEEEEFRRLHEEKQMERLAPVSEDGQPEFHWDGLRRRRTTIGSQHSRRIATPRSVETPAHPPLGRTHWPTEEELEEERARQMSPALTSIVGTIRSRARSVLLPGHPDFNHQDDNYPPLPPLPNQQSPMHPVQLTDISYGGAAGVESDGGRRIQFGDPHRPTTGTSSLAPPTPPPHGGNYTARRQFSFQNVFRRHQADGAPDQHEEPEVHTLQPARRALRSRGYSDRQMPPIKDATEEERLGLVKGDSASMPALPLYSDEMEQAGYRYEDNKQPYETHGRLITSPPRRPSDESELETMDYEESRKRWRERSESRGPSPGASPPRGGPPKSSGASRGNGGSFI